MSLLARSLPPTPTRPSAGRPTVHRPARRVAVAAATRHPPASPTTAAVATLTQLLAASSALAADEPAAAAAAATGGGGVNVFEIGVALAPALFYGLLTLARQVNPKIKISDLLFVLAGAVIVANIVSILVFKKRIY